MIEFQKFTLDNGLRVIVHEDKSTALACMNILYDVGARDEHPDKTGFAHLFEHLMFGGSLNIPSYDEPLQKAGGENNAFTNNDITNYYLTLPAENIETGFWLESDRMLSLAFSDKSLEVQRNVVIEEYKQRYLNQPYGDVWLLLRPLVYKVHPYQWATIGKEISHIKNATMNDVRDFFFRFYRPNNAIMVVAGNINADYIMKLAEKWFGNIPAGTIIQRNLPQEPVQVEARKISVNRDVPLDALYKVYHSCARSDEEFYTVDLISDILSQGDSSRFYNELVKNKKLFSEIRASVSGEFDKGMFIVSGKVNKGIKMEDAEAAIIVELDKLRTETIKEEELTKVKNKVESTSVFSETEVLNKAMNLAFAEPLGDANNVSKEIEKYLSVTDTQIKEQAGIIFKESNCSTLYYHSKN